jgi:hypothetical protein
MQNACIEPVFGNIFTTSSDMKKPEGVIVQLGGQTALN